MGQYGRQESKTGRKAVAMEWNSIPAGLPFSPDGIWPVPTNQEEDALTRVRADCVQQQSAATPHYWRALRSFNTGSASTTPPPSGSTGASSSSTGALIVGNWPVLTWQPSATASPDTLWLFAEEGYMWFTGYGRHPVV